MKVIKLALKEFALPSPRTGSLEANSGFGSSAKEGMELHQLVQKQRQRDFPDYKAEVTIKHEFHTEAYLFQVEGRIDGIFQQEVPLIEEIKSAFNIWELAKTIREKKEDHPYALQLLMYGYLYWKKFGVIPDLNLHLVSTRNHETMDLDFKLKPHEFENWLERRLEELTQDAIRAEKRSKRRMDLAEKISFPFEKPRLGQVDLIKTIEENFKHKSRMLIQAPTGLGKTVGVLYPSLKDSLKRGQQTIYVTPKNSQHSVAEDALDKFEGKGCHIKSLTVTAKSKMCFKAEPLCNPEYCEFAKDYYDKLAKHELKELLSKKRKLTSRVFKNLGKKHEVCPFELQLEAVEEADSVICDYNYVFSDRATLGGLNNRTFAKIGNPNLVVDEAHNLPSRAMSYYSPALSGSFLEKLRDDLIKLPKKIKNEGEDILNDLLRVIQDLKPTNTQKPVHINLPIEPFLEEEEKVKRFLTKYLESNIEIKPKDVVLRMCFYWCEFTEVLKSIAEDKRPEFFFTYHPEGLGTVKITCCDASEMIKTKYEAFDQVVLFSATLKPFEYYLKLSGLAADTTTHEFESPFLKDNRKLLIIPQISTKYSDRERSIARIQETISRVVALKPGNYLVFFSSFDFMDRVYSSFNCPLGFRVKKQFRNFKNEQAEEIIVSLREEKIPTILFAVQGGIFSEGVDFPGDMVIGAFVIGPPLPNFDIERESMRDYYQKHFNEGFEYAYTYPAMAKAVQAAGRVIRTEDDRGVVILVDERFLHKNYAKTMPKDWFLDSPNELVSQSILHDLTEFWKILPNPT